MVSQGKRLFANDSSIVIYISHWTLVLVSYHCSA